MSDSESINNESNNGYAKQGGGTKSKHGETQSQQNQRLNTAASSTFSENPFKIPSDDLIFTFKDDEKRRKLAEKEANKKLKLWEKNRPIREGCLRKLTETDIQPSGIAISSKVTSKVNMNEFNSFTVPIERPKRQETTHQIKEKKRQIFLAQQLNETKYAEIERLANHNEMRQMGLLCSEKMLEADTKAFLDFFASIKKQTMDAGQELEQLKKQKTDATQELRAIDDECGVIHSQINKNIEILDKLLHYKEFLDDVVPEQEKAIIKKRKDAKAAKKQAEKEAAAKAKEAESGQKRSRSKNQAPEEQVEVNKLFDEITMPKQVKRALLDNDVENTIFFKDSSDLMSIFETYEDKNLFLIQQGQENEQQIEEKKQQQNQEILRIEFELSKLDKNEQEIQNKLDKTVREYSNLKMQTTEANNKSISAGTCIFIDEKTTKILKYFSPETKNVSTLIKLTEIEKAIEAAEAQIAYWQSHDEPKKSPEDQNFSDLVKSVKSQVKQTNSDENQKQKDKLEAELRAKKERKQSNKPVLTEQRKMMFISSKKEVKKQKEKKIELTQDQIDQRKYLGDQLQLPVPTK